MKILVTGTPGVGKTTLSSKISKLIDIEHIDITALVKEKKLYEIYDQRLDTLIFDEDTVIDYLDNYLKGKKSFIIDTHSPVVGENIDFDMIVHVVCDTKTIAERLEARKYSTEKIQENIEAEIFDVIGEDLSEIFDREPIKVLGCDSSSQEDELTFDQILSKIQLEFSSL